MRLLCTTLRIAGAMRPNARSATNLWEGVAGSHILSEQYVKWHLETSPVTDDWQISLMDKAEWYERPDFSATVRGSRASNRPALFRRWCWPVALPGRDARSQL